MNQQPSCITITRDDLRNALCVWEMDNRAGKMRPEAEARALTVDQRAEESTAYLWEKLVLLIAS